MAMTWLGSYTETVSLYDSISMAKVIMLCRTVPITVELGVYINYIYAISEQTMVRDIRTFTLKPGFHYPSWQPELTDDRFPLPVNSGSGNRA